MPSKISDTGLVGESARIPDGQRITSFMPGFLFVLRRYFFIGKYLLFLLCDSMDIRGG
jgi:hypothetical protein